MKNNNWWLINGIWVIVVGLLNAVLNLGGLTSTLLFASGLNIVMGIALIKKSMLAFWLTLLLTGVSFVSQIMALVSISKATGNYPLGLGFWLTIISLALLLMLWQEIKKSKEIAKK
jgi:hypothetical protein